MPANIDAVRADADAIASAETELSGILYDLSFAADYGHGSTSEAIESVRSARRHADRAMVSAAAGNAAMAAKHEAQAAAAEDDASRMLKRADGYTDDLLRGLEVAAAKAGTAIDRAESMVELDDSSPAADVHAQIAAQQDAIRAYVERTKEVQGHLPGSRDPAELQVVAEHFVALRHELEEGSGRARAIASDASAYGSAI